MTLSLRIIKSNAERDTKGNYDDRSYEVQTSSTSLSSHLGYTTYLRHSPSNEQSVR